MNNRDYRKFGRGEYYHIYNRGNAKADIFLDDEDFSFFLLRLAQNLFPARYQGVRLSPLPERSFSMISYCLMPNHFHFLLRQDNDIPTSRLLSKVCTSYSKYFNKKYNRVGHVFQDAFKQITVHDNSYLLWLSAYIHNNPVVAGFTSNPFEYQWSSYGEFFGVGEKNICDPRIILDQLKSKEEYKRFVRESTLLIKERKDLKSVLFD